MQTIDLKPRPSLLMESLRSMGYRLETALADVIDNSVAAGARNISVRFLWANAEPWIAILDDGHGMTQPELIEAMRFGSRSPHARRADDDLGRFGLGMKTASISQCRLLTVISRVGGTLSACSWDLEYLSRNESQDWEIFVHTNDTLLASPVIAPLLGTLAVWGTGTIVCWENIDGMFPDKTAVRSEARFSDLMDGARTHLELVFHRFLSPEPGHQSVRIDFNGNSLKAFDPFGPKHPARQELTLEIIQINGECVEVQPYVLPHHSKIPRSEYEAFGSEEGYLQSQGFYLYRNRRLIVKGTWFRLLRKEVLNKLIRVRVDIPNSLDALWRIDVKKAEADPPETVLKELRKLVNRIAGMGQRVYTRRATRLADGPLVSVWKREIVEGKVRYSLNEDHPLLSELLSDEDGTRAARARACLRLVSNAFPSDVYFSDAASDSVEFGPPSDDASHLEVVARLIDALRRCGFSGDELREQVLKTEFPPISPESLEKLLVIPPHA
jgi:hypothetical protein